MNKNPPDILSKILKTKRAEVNKLHNQKNDFLKTIKNNKKALNFLEALKNPKSKPSIISEIKKASPSAGIIEENFDPIHIGRTYQKSGADAISILTDSSFFKGSNEHLKLVRQYTTLPILRKDFIISQEQVYESRALGADSLLLISSILDKNTLKQLLKLSRQLEMEPLVEINNLTELNKALETDCKIIGINNRNLKDFSVNFNNTENLISYIPEDKVIVGESGVNSIEKSKKLKEIGCNAILIGEFLMKSNNKEEIIHNIKNSV